MKIEQGVMVVKNGKAWGRTYDDGHDISFGWMALDDAPIYRPGQCKKPTDVTYPGSKEIAELETATVVCVKRITETIIYHD